MSGIFEKLPDGWFPIESEQVDDIEKELHKELPPGHLLFGEQVAAIAYRKDCDDVLFQHRLQPDRFSLVHLTWIGKQERNVNLPYVEVDGNFQAFLDYEKENRK